jgi:CRP/FNR family transcriptional regulator, cyclic AMP receptor protein
LHTQCQRFRSNYGLKPSMKDRLDYQQQILLSPFFDGLPEDAIKQAIAKVVVREHPPDRVIVLEKDWGNSVYFVLSGWVKIRIYDPDGKEVTLNILGKGEMFGEMSALDRTQRSTDVITLTQATIASLPAPDFVHLVETEHKACIYLARLMAKRLRQVNRRLLLRGAGATSRVADILLFLAEGQGIKGSNGIEIPNLPQRELASLSGLARETVTNALGRLERKKLILRDTERDILCILDVEGLEKIMD